ncbi:MAG: DUF1338 domain-containing protein [Flavobacteriaceae bacterium]|nr:DUF1338 domain-containing protein [Flavobacteriaceae bacterium]
MNLTQLLHDLWCDYTKRTPSAAKIQQLFNETFGAFKNDHIAIRTFNITEVAIDIIAKPFLELGYVEKDSYYFSQKKLNAKHYEHPTNPDAPLLFISEIVLENFSEKTQHLIRELMYEVNEDSPLITQGRTWPVSYAIYLKLLQESEYIAWLYVNGFCVNHFTVAINSIDSTPSLQKVNNYLKEQGFQLNNSGGEIKGNPAVKLEQSSILADMLTINFNEGNYQTTSCYYEFAYRHLNLDGTVFKGFITESADKIFESTDLALMNS